jgi:hypothetical protein
MYMAAGSYARWNSVYDMLFMCLWAENTLPRELGATKQVWE